MSKDQRAAWHWVGVPHRARPGRVEGIRDHPWLRLATSDPEGVGGRLIQGAVPIPKDLG